MGVHKLSVAAGANDRTLPLMAGLIKTGDLDLAFEFSTAPLETIFATAFDEATYDVSELSFSNFLYLTAAGGCPYVGLPVFPSRSFRHSAIYIRDDRGIDGPRDLIGRDVGVREYSMTAALVARGVLEDEFGVRAQDLKFLMGRADAKDQPPIPRLQPRGIDLAMIGDDETLSGMLADGRLDAMIAYKPPKAFVDRHPNIRRLFCDFPSVERDYFRRTGHFPIMHLIGVRRELIDADPTLAARICEAFERSRAYSSERLGEMQAPYTMLPWGAREAEGTLALAGRDPWAYGVAPNSNAIAALCRYSHAQGIAPREMTTAELFAEETLGWCPDGATDKG